jgi:hypothetical protein
VVPEFIKDTAITKQVEYKGVPVTTKNKAAVVNFDIGLVKDDAVGGYKLVVWGPALMNGIRNEDFFVRAGDKVVPVYPEELQHFNPATHELEPLLRAARVLMTSNERDQEQATKKLGELQQEKERAAGASALQKILQPSQDLQNKIPQPELKKTSALDLNEAQIKAISGNLDSLRTSIATAISNLTSGKGIRKVTEWKYVENLKLLANYIMNLNNLNKVLEAFRKNWTVKLGSDWNLLGNALNKFIPANQGKLNDLLAVVNERIKVLEEQESARVSKVSLYFDQMIKAVPNILNINKFKEAAERLDKKAAESKKKKKEAEAVAEEEWGA